MTTGNTHIRLVAAVAALLVVAAIGARAAQARPDSWKLHYQTEAARALQAGADTTSQQAVPDAFERAVNAKMNAPYPDAFERAVNAKMNAPYPDAFERAVNAQTQGGQAQIDVRQPDSILPPQSTDVRQPDSIQPQVHDNSPVSTDGSGNSFDWGLFALFCAICAGIGAVGGAALVTARHRERVAHL